MMKLRFLAVFAVTLAGLGHAEDLRYRWNLNDLYASPAAWDADTKQLTADMAQVNACQGQLGSGADRLQKCLDLYFVATKRLYRLFVYANLRRDDDTSDPAGTERSQRAGVLRGQFSEATAFVRPELLELGTERLQTLLHDSPGLAMYRHFLDDIERAASHTLDKEGESLIAAFSLISDTAQATQTLFSNAELTRPTVKLSDGTEALLDDSGYETYRQVENRNDRKLVFDEFWAAQKHFEGTLGMLLYKSMQKDQVEARVRHYPDSLSAKLDDHRIPAAVYQTLIEQVNLGLPTLHRYMRLRGRLLGIADLRYYDLYPPLVHSPASYTPEVSERLTLEAVKPLGDAYVREMRSAFDDRWVDFYPRPHKASGGYMAGYAYDVHPYLLLNHDNTYQSASTFAHEFGHAMHTRLTDAAQPFVYSAYPIFIAEIASTCNEQLLLDHMLKVAKTDDERILYLGSALESLRGTFFRQAMFAEFERDAHAMVDRGEPLSGAKFTQLYGTILKRYHGDAQGVMKIDDLYTVEWSFIPHFYNSFYVFQYATSVAASSLFADAILQKKPGAQERYLELLRAGGSDYPYELVKRAGVDLATAAPYQSLVSRMNRIMDQIDAIEAKRKH
jgi:oligoendopeptidase F